jgi:2-C-methyl-D-erythritol 4-phosphate cytidylyltransferase
MPGLQPDPPAVAAAVVVAAGRGERFGAPDKVMQLLDGRPLVAHVLDSIEAAPTIREVVVVTASHTRSTVEALIGAGSWTKPRSVVLGGERRQESVANGIAATSAELPVVAIHDAARPLTTPDLFVRCVTAALERRAAIAAIPVADTIKRVRNGLVRETIPREELWAAQTPQAFRRELIAAALADPLASGSTFTDEAGLLEALGQPVTIAIGDLLNLKITVPADLALAEAILTLRRSVIDGNSPPALSTVSSPAITSNT